MVDDRESQLREAAEVLQSAFFREKAKVDRLRETLVAARAEIDRHGYGDFHWGPTPRDEGVLKMLATIDEVLDAL